MAASSRHQCTLHQCCRYLEAVQNLLQLCLCRYVACMNPTAGSFVVNPRLQRLFMTLAVEFPGQESLMKIYGTFVTGHLKKFSADVQVPARTLLLHASCSRLFWLFRIHFKVLWHDRCSGHGSYVAPAYYCFSRVEDNTPLLHQRPN